MGGGEGREEGREPRTRYMSACALGHLLCVALVLLVC